MSSLKLKFLFDSAKHTARNVLRGATIVVLFAGFVFPAVMAEDVLLLKETDGVQERKCEIVEWQGDKITITSGSRTRTIDAAKVVDVRSDWCEELTEARLRLKQRKFGDAYGLFTTAIKKEKRIWVRHEVMAGIIQCLQATGNHSTAIKVFLELVAQDPETRFMHLMPLEWAPADSGRPATSETSTWMDSNNEFQQLLGASWSLAGPARSDANQTLHELTQSNRKTIATFAASQIWRTRLVAAKEEEIDRWQNSIKKVPMKLRAGPIFVVASAQSQRKQNDHAAANYLRIPILYPTNRALSAAALYRAGRVLQNADRPNEAKKVWSELIRHYPDTNWAKQSGAKQN